MVIILYLHFVNEENTFSTLPGKVAFKSTSNYCNFISICGGGGGGFNEIKGISFYYSCWFYTKAKKNYLTKDKCWLVFYTYTFYSNLYTFLF